MFNLKINAIERASSALEMDLKEMVTRITTEIESELLQTLEMEARDSYDAMEWGAYRTATQAVIETFRKYGVGK